MDIGTILLSITVDIKKIAFDIHIDITFAFDPVELLKTSHYMFGCALKKPIYLIYDIFRVESVLTTPCNA